MKFAFLAKRRKVCLRGKGLTVEEAEAGVGGPAGMKREGIVAIEDIKAI